MRDVWRGLTVALGAALLAVWGCQGTAPCQDDGFCVDCTALCQRMTACGVAYGSELPVNDSPQTRCEFECMRSDTMTPERARCITDADTSNRQACQQHVVGCLGVDAGAVPQTAN